MILDRVVCGDAAAQFHGDAIGLAPRQGDRIAGGGHRRRRRGRRLRACDGWHTRRTRRTELVSGWCWWRTDRASARPHDRRIPIQHRPRNRGKLVRGYGERINKHCDHDLGEPVWGEVGGGGGVLLKPLRCSLDSSFIAFSTARSIPRAPNPQATTAAAQSPGSGHARWQ